VKISASSDVGPCIGLRRRTSRIYLTAHTLGHTAQGAKMLCLS